MRLEKNIKIGELLELYINGQTYRTKLQDITGDTFTVLNPTDKGLPVPILQDDIINVRFYRSSGVFEFDARMQERFIKGRLQLCRLLIISELKRSQRRASFRLPIILKVQLWRVDDEEKKKHKAKTVDISEHGILLTCFEIFSKGTKLYAEINMTDTEKRIFEAEVLRCEQPYNDSEPKKMVLMYINISESDRNYLGRFIMRQQILARKKGARK
ncbi:MAG: flagellar brake protein [Christensenellales bacterium]